VHCQTLPVPEMQSAKMVSLSRQVAATLNDTQCHDALTSWEGGGTKENAARAWVAVSTSSASTAPFASPARSLYACESVQELLLPEI
jgi:hypothetical protein